MPNSITEIANRRFAIDFSNQRQVLGWLQELFACAQSSYILPVPEGRDIAEYILNHWHWPAPYQQGTVRFNPPEDGDALVVWLVSACVDLLWGQSRDVMVVSYYGFLSIKIREYLITH